MKYHKYVDGKWFEPVIPEGETVKVGLRAADNTVSYVDVPVTQDILIHVAGTKDGSYHTVSLLLLGKKLPYCKSYFIAD